jgi:hypothetical protein
MQQKNNNKKINLLFGTFFIIIIVVIVLFILNSCTAPKQSKSLPFYDSQKGNTYLYYNQHNSKMTRKQIMNAKNGYNLYYRQNGKMHKSK